MTDDATLTDFLEDDDPSSDDATVSDDDAEPDSSAAAESGASLEASADASSPEPVTPTSAWGAYTCRDCGSSVTRVWHDGDGVVCGSCKRW